MSDDPRHPGKHIRISVAQWRTNSDWWSAWKWDDIHRPDREPESDAVAGTMADAHLSCDRSVPEDEIIVARANGRRQALVIPEHVRRQAYAEARSVRLREDAERVGQKRAPRFTGRHICQACGADTHTGKVGRPPSLCQLCREAS